MFVIDTRNMLLKLLFIFYNILFTGLPNSPSSDKSIENYEEETQPQTPNGKIKRVQVQRYDTSDLYKPKLHFLSRRSHIT